MQPTTTPTFSLKTSGARLRAYAMVGALALIWGVFFLTTDGAFVSPRNMSNLARQSCITGLLAIGMVLVIVSANIDLSVGSLVGLTGGMAAIMSVWGGWPLWLVVLATLGLGLLMGFCQGALVAYARVPSFIVTLAGLLIFRGIIKGATGGATVGPLPETFKMIGQDYLPLGWTWGLAAGVALVVAAALWQRARQRRAYGFDAPSTGRLLGLAALYAALIVTFAGVMNSYAGLPVPVLILLVMALAFHFLATQTTFGRRVYAIGGNAEAAHLSGINLRRNVTTVFMLMGLLSAVAGMIYTARVGSATADAGKILELDAIAACVIGGTSLMGGRGTIAGALLGALIMASLDNGMSLMNVEDFYQDIIKGLILVIAVGIDVAGKKK